MNWNPFKRIAELRAQIEKLEELHCKNLGVLDLLTTKLNSQNQWLVSLQNQVFHRDDPKHPGAPVTISREDVEREARKRVQRNQYARAYYAKKKAAKAAGGAK